MSASGPTLYPADFPSRAVFRFPPDAAPAPIPPPWTGEATFANPFPIPIDIYQGALSYKVPLYIAAVYAVVVTYFNWYNRQHGNKAWRIAKTRPFFAFVIFHNVFLAVYSAVTCVAMFKGLKRSFPHYSEPNALVGTVDALCKIHGPRGLGDAVTYRPDAHEWGSRNANITLGAEGLPDYTDVGRVWNEGLAFWGWWFYLSKFYEVLDTAIILAKGKRSTTLQKYHHAGAMLSMWAGMRFMSPPIWMFVLVNSGIHAMMYTYYTLSALGYRVPNAVKRTLTTMQIMQFLLGSTTAAIHLFVSYTVPVAIAYQVAEKIAPVTSVVTSTVASVTTVTPEVLATATVPALHFLRKLIYRAAGDEGLAENIPAPGVPTPVQRGHLAPPHPEHPIEHFFHREHRNKTVYRTEYQHVPCIDTSGQAFAIYLNLIYLAPLTILFMRFFFKSYLRRTSPKTKSSKHPIVKASRDAARGVGRELESLDESPDGVATGIDKSKDGVRGRKPTSNGNAKEPRSSLSPGNQDFVQNVSRKVSQRLQEIDESAQATGKKAKEVAQNVAQNVVDKAQETKAKVEEQWNEGSKALEQTKENVEQGLENGQKKAGEIKDEVAEQTQDLKEEAKKQSDIAANKAGEIKDEVKDQAHNAQEEAGKQTQNSQPEGTPLSKKAKKKAQESRIPSPKKKALDQSSSSMVIVEKEPEPKDLNNTLAKGEGKGTF